jgi:hypothetical protein
MKLVEQAKHLELCAAEVPLKAELAASMGNWSQGIYKCGSCVYKVALKTDSSLKSMVSRLDLAKLELYELKHEGSWWWLLHRDRTHRLNEALRGSFDEIAGYISDLIVEIDSCIKRFEETEKHGKLKHENTAMAKR